MPTARRPALKKPVSLRAEGLRTRDDLVAVGAVEACRRLRVAGFPVTLLAAYGIEAGLMACTGMRCQ